MCNGDRVFQAAGVSSLQTRCVDVAAVLSLLADASVCNGPMNAVLSDASIRNGLLDAGE